MAAGIRMMVRHRASVFTTDYAYGLVYGGRGVGWGKGKVWCAMGNGKREEDLPSVWVVVHEWLLPGEGEVIEWLLPGEKGEMNGCCLARRVR